MKNWKDLIVWIVVIIFIGFLLFGPAGFVWRWYLDITQPNVCIDGGCFHSIFVD